MAKLTPTPQEAAYPRKGKTAAIDRHWEASYWLTLSSTRLKRMLKMERRRGVAHAWDYQPGRHSLMLEVYRTVKAREDEAKRLRK